MANHEYGLYDRVLDWFSDNRQMIAKVLVVGAVAAMVLVTFLGALLSAL